MSYGLRFTTNTGKEFTLDALIPSTYVGTYTISSNFRLTVPELVGRATLHAELTFREFMRSGNGQVSSLLRYTIDNTTKGSISINFSNINIGSFTCSFVIYGVIQ